jgi:hypothetical protein
LGGLNSPNSPTAKIFCRCIVFFTRVHVWRDDDMARGEITGQKPKGQSRASVNVPPILGPPAAYSIAAFCAAHDLSEGMYFKIRKQGLGPREMRVGSRVLITQEAAAAWRRERESETAAAS